MSTLLQTGSETITLITTDLDTFVLFPMDNHDNLFYATARFAGTTMLGADSVVHGLLYTDRRGVVRIGVFDVSRVRGVALRQQSCLEWHTEVHALMHSFGGEQHIHYHWSGHESHCM